MTIRLSALCSTFRTLPRKPGRAAQDLADGAEMGFRVGNGRQPFSSLVAGKRYTVFSGSPSRVLPHDPPADTANNPNDAYGQDKQAKRPLQLVGRKCVKHQNEPDRYES